MHVKQYSDQYHAYDPTTLQAMAISMGLAVY